MLHSHCDFYTVDCLCNQQEIADFERWKLNRNVVVSGVRFEKFVMSTLLFVVCLLKLYQQQRIFIIK